MCLRPTGLLDCRAQNSSSLGRGIETLLSGDIVFLRAVILSATAEGVLATRRASLVPSSSLFVDAPRVIDGLRYALRTVTVIILQRVTDAPHAQCCLPRGGGWGGYPPTLRCMC